MQNTTDHAIQNYVYWKGGIFTSIALESLSPLTGQQMKKESAGSLGSPGLSDLLFVTPDFTNLAFYRGSWRQKNCSYFSIFGFFWRQLAHAIILVSSLFKYLAEKCY